MSFYLDQDLVRGLCDEYSAFLTEDNELLGSLEKTLAEYGSDQELSSQAVEASRTVGEALLETIRCQLECNLCALDDIRSLKYKLGSGVLDGEKLQQGYDSLMMDYRDSCTLADYYQGLSVSEPALFSFWYRSQAEVYRETAQWCLAAAGRVRSQMDLYYQLESDTMSLFLGVEEGRRLLDAALKSLANRIAGGITGGITRGEDFSIYRADWREQYQRSMLMAFGLSGQMLAYYRSCGLSEEFLYSLIREGKDPDTRRFLKNAFAGGEIESLTCLSDQEMEELTPAEQSILTQLILGVVSALPQTKMGTKTEFMLTPNIKVAISNYMKSENEMAAVTLWTDTGERTYSQLLSYCISNITLRPEREVTNGGYSESQVISFSDEMSFKLTEDFQKGVEGELKVQKAIAEDGTKVKLTVSSRLGEEAASNPSMEMKGGVVLTDPATGDTYEILAGVTGEASVMVLSRKAVVASVDNQKQTVTTKVEITRYPQQKKNRKDKGEKKPPENSPKEWSEMTYEERAEALGITVNGRAPLYSELEDLRRLLQAESLSEVFQILCSLGFLFGAGWEALSEIMSLGLVPGF